MARITKSNCHKQTLEQAFQEFRLAKEVCNLSRATITNYQQSYNMLVMFNGFTVKTLCVEIEEMHIQQLVMALRKAEVSNSSINHYLRDVRAFLYWCMDKGYISTFKIPLINQQEEQLKLFTDVELTRLLRKPTPNDSFATWRTWAIVNWVLGTGNRASTICEIHLSDIDYTAREISLRHTKNKRTQIIPLSTTLESALKEYIRMWRADATEDEYLFPNICNNMLSTSALRQSFSDYCASREVARTNIHGLRHNFAKGWLRNGGNMFILQRILGHSTLEMTRKYVRLFVEDMKEGYDEYSPLDTICKGKSRLSRFHKK